METADVLRPGAAGASVRPARAADAEAMGAVQARAWSIAYRDVLPPGAAAGLRADQLAPAWRHAVTSPPSARHVVLVACAGAAVVGFAAAGPSSDTDADGGDAELVALEVDPAHHRGGHGSRLLSATVAALQDRGFRNLRSWCPDGDGPRRAFLESAGLRADGAHRTLATGEHRAGQARLAAELPDD